MSGVSEYSLLDLAFETEESHSDLLEHLFDQQYMDIDDFFKFYTKKNSMKDLATALKDNPYCINLKELHEEIGKLL